MHFLLYCNLSSTTNRIHLPSYDVGDTQISRLLLEVVASSILAKNMGVPGFAPSSWLGSKIPGSNPDARFPGRKAIITSRQRSIVRCSRVLIINCPSGGHGFLGAHLSSLLLKNGHSVRLLHSGESVPASIAEMYTDLEKGDGKFEMSYGEIPSAVDEKFDVVYDNYSKSTDDARLALEQAAAGAEVHYVSSAGAYKEPPNGIAPSRTGDTAAGATIDVESALSAAGARGASFRPIYIYGKGSAKRAYLDYFFDRIVRDKPVFVPGTGSELTSLTDVRDVVSMLAAAQGKQFNGRQIFNAVSPRAVTFDGVAKMCAAVVGKDLTIQHFDPAVAEENIPGFKLKKYFSFRVRHFFADPSSAIKELGWVPEYSGTSEQLLASIREAYEEYKQLGLHEKTLSFDTDEAIAAAMG